MSAIADQLLFAPKGITDCDRFAEFIDWAEPFGSAHINGIHKQGYVRSNPWFEYSSNFLPNSHNTSRSWFIRAECAAEEKIFNRPKKQTTPKIFKPQCLIQDGKYLHFAKAYVNVMVFLSGVRSPPKAMVTALSHVEQQLRRLNQGRNDPELINQLCFTRAAQAVMAKEGNPSSKYDVGQQLQVMAGMLQSGYHSKTFRYAGKGFKLLTSPFAFKSPIPQPSRDKAVTLDDEEVNVEDARPITSEAVAAIGIAYARSKSDCKEGHAATLMASLPGLALTTVSMRMSDLVELRSDALYFDQDTGRTRIRIFRPKPDEHQNLPVAEKLESLAKDYFTDILSFGVEAREAFSFYTDRFGDSFKDIDELFIPERYQWLLSQELLTCDDAWRALGLPASSSGYFPQRFGHFSVSRAIRLPDGTLLPVGQKIREVVAVGQIIVACQAAGISFKAELGELKFRYLTRMQAHSYLCCDRKRAVAALSKIFESPIKTIEVIQTSDLLAEMLKDFKSMAFPNWPYLSKARVTKLNQALLVWNDQNSASECDPGNQERLWWRPTMIAVGTINSWISGTSARPPILFQLLDVRLANGDYPSITIHQTRKRHHTQALLAGVSETFADQLAGRKSGMQSGFYDKRSAKEILSQSIEGFDPDTDFEAIGPAMELAPPPTKIVERRVFMFNNLAPKQVTDVGGCRADWSLNPCEMLGDCMRCDKSVWQKGDLKRLPRILEIYEHARRMLLIGEEKLRRSPNMKTIERHIQQFKETIFRCEWIFAVEADPSIPVGTIVSFESGPTAFTSSELASWVRQRREVRQTDCACH